MKRVLVALSFIGVLMTACSKSGSSVDDSAAVIGKWTLLSHREKSTTSGIVTYDQTSTSAPGMYMNFKTNGSYVYRIYDSSTSSYAIDSSTYKVSGSNLLDNGSGINYQILNLTSTSMTLYSSSEFTFLGVKEKDENWMNLTK